MYTKAAWRARVLHVIIMRCKSFFSDGGRVVARVAALSRAQTLLSGARGRAKRRRRRRRRKLYLIGCAHICIHVSVLLYGL